MKTLDEEIYEILKVCRTGWSEVTLRKMAAGPCPLVGGVTKEETLLLYKLWRCYKERAENEWRTEYFKCRYPEDRLRTYSIQGYDFVEMVEDIRDVKSFIILRKKTVKNLQTEFENSYFTRDGYVELLPDTYISEYTRYVIASAAAWVSFLASADDNPQKQKRLHNIMRDCGETVYESISAILEEIEVHLGMVKAGTLPKQIEIKTDADMISALEACTSKAKEWRAKIEKLQADNEGLKKELEAKEAKIEEQGEKIAAFAQDEKPMEALKKENEVLREEIARLRAESMQQAETDSIDKYFTFNKLVEVIEETYEDYESARDAMDIMRKMVDTDENPQAAQVVLKKMKEVEKYLKKKGKNKFGDYVNGNKIVNNHDGKESK